MAQGDQPDSRGTPMSRRRMLTLTGLGALGLAAGGDILAACGGDNKGGGTAATTAAGGAGTTGAALQKVRIGFAYIGPTNDNGWTFEHDRGRQQMVSELGDKVTTNYVENVLFDPAQTTPIFEDLASKNDLVIANTEYATLLSDVAAKHPKVKFLECDGHTYTDNLYAYYVAHAQPCYALGVAAALLNPGKPLRIGYVGAFPTATAYNDVNGLILGARSITQDVTVKAVMISSFFDPPKATAATEALLNENINFLFSVMDEPSFLQVANKAGVWTATWNTDVRQFGPDVYVNTLQLNWGPYYVQQAKAMLDGTWTAKKQPDLLPLDLGAWGDKVPQEVRTKVDDVRKKLLSGELNPYTGPIKDDKGAVRVKEGEKLDDQKAYLIDWSAEGVTGVQA
jgi:basic membrane lipoprotein Med (substrate-binding protein (PBP1-ABC) superfamily)